MAKITTPLPSSATGYLFNDGAGGLSWDNLPVWLQPIGYKYNYSAAQPSPTLTIIDVNGNTLTNPQSLIAMNPLFQNQRVNLDNAGNIRAYWGDAAFSYTGSNGQCMTRFQAGYYKSVNDTANKILYDWVCPLPYPGFSVHPGFMSNGMQNSQFFIGTFPASIYDSTAGTYLLNDEAYTAGNTNMLASIAGVGGTAAKPASGKNNAGLTKTVFRTFAQNRGTGWNLWGINQVAWIELLTYIKYGTFNLQATFPGVSNITDDGSTNMAVRNGATAGYGGISGASDLGNTDGQVSIAHYQTGQTTYPFNLLGLEDWYANAYSWVDYLKIHNNIPWIADYSPNDTTTYPYTAPYVNSGLTLLASNDWPTQLARNSTIKYGFLPVLGGGSSASGLCDNYYQASGDMAALFGGVWNGGASCGPAFWILDNPASLVYRKLGGRVFFAKKS